MSQHETIQDYLARNSKPKKGFFGTFYESNSLFFGNLKVFFDCCKKPVFYVTSAAFLFIILQLYASIASETNKVSMALSIAASILAAIIGIFIYALSLPTTALLAKDVYEACELKKTNAYEKIVFSNIKNFLKFTFLSIFIIAICFDFAINLTFIIEYVTGTFTKGIAVSAFLIFLIVLLMIAHVFISTTLMNWIFNDFKPTGIVEVFKNGFKLASSNFIKFISFLIVSLILPVFAAFFISIIFFIVYVAPLFVTGFYNFGITSPYYILVPAITVASLICALISCYIYFALTNYFLKIKGEKTI